MPAFSALHAKRHHTGTRRYTPCLHYEAGYFDYFATPPAALLISFVADYALRACVMLCRRHCR